MSDFWWGVLALPLLLLAVSVLVGVVVGAWLLAEKWAEVRTRELNYDNGWEGTYQRHAAATWVLLAPKMRRFRLGWGSGLLFYRGLNNVSKEQFREVRTRLPSALRDLDDAV